MSEMTPADWDKFLAGNYVDEPYPRAPIVRPSPYCEQDQPPPSPNETARRLARDRALQRWYTTPSATMPFAQWFATVLTKSEK
jgi:hypothetical protein